MRRTAILLTVVLIAIPAYAERADAVRRTHLHDTYGQLPLTFELNRGQATRAVKFLARTPGEMIFLTPSEVVLSMPSAPPLRMRLIGGNREPKLEGLDPLPGISNYFIGNDPSKWQTGVPTFARVRYKDVYRGIDLVFYGSENRLEYDFDITTGADPRVITMRFDGAKRIEVSGDALILHTAAGDFRQLAPRVYQQVGGKRIEVRGRYVLASNHEVRFDLGPYDAKQKLVIDPVVLVYSSYHGGSNDDYGRDIAVDASGNAYITGTTYSTNFPTAGTYSYGTCNGCGGSPDAFLAKYNSSGTARVFSTYIGTSHSEDGRALALDPQGNVWVTGTTTDSGAMSAFPGLGSGGLPPNTGTLGGSNDIYVAKFNSTNGQLLGSFLFGGSTGTEEPHAIAIDNFDAFPGSGNGTGIWIVGMCTNDAGFPDLGTWSTPQGSNDPFILRFEDQTLRIGGRYSGSSADSAEDIAVDPTGWAYVVGWTNSLDFPTVNGLQPAHSVSAQSQSDAFIMKIHPSGIVENATYFGGTGSDVAHGVAIQASQYTNGFSPAWITGETTSTNFPTTNGAYRTTAVGRGDAWVAKMTLPFAGAPQLLYSTYLGGTGSDTGNSIAVDKSGNAYVGGMSSGNTFPFVSSVQGTPCLGNGAFVAKLDPAGAALIYASQIGCGIAAEAYVAIDRSNNAYVTGKIANSLPIMNAVQAAPGGNAEAFIAKIEQAPSTFTDDPIIIGDPVSGIIKAVHINELRTRIDALRVRYGLTPFAWADPAIHPQVTLVRMQHIVDLRTALAQTYTAGNKGAPPAYTDPNLAAGTIVKAVHISQLRAAVVAIE